MSRFERNPNEERVARRQLSPDEMDAMSTAMINAGVNMVKRNKVTTSFYLVGLILCLVFNGLSVPAETMTAYEMGIDEIDWKKSADAKETMVNANMRFRRAQGWFWTCDARCQPLKATYLEKEKKYRELLAIDNEKVRDLKGSLGIFSNIGVRQTRDAFSEYFARGKQFATRQSKWDAFFIGIDSMGRDEGMMSYLLRVLLNVLFNFTIGMVGTVISFIWGLYGIIQQYKAPLWTGLLFFLGAALAAISFALTWVLGLYLGTAGVVFVGAKAIASNMRLEGGQRAGTGGRIDDRGVRQEYHPHAS